MALILSYIEVRIWSVNLPGALVIDLLEPIGRIGSYVTHVIGWSTGMEDWQLCGTRDWLKYWNGGLAVMWHTWLAEVLEWRIGSYVAHVIGWSTGMEDWQLYVTHEIVWSGGLAVMWHTWLAGVLEWRIVSYM